MIQTSSNVEWPSFSWRRAAAGRFQDPPRKFLARIRLIENSVTQSLYLAPCHSAGGRASTARSSSTLTCASNGRAGARRPARKSNVKPCLTCRVWAPRTAARASDVQRPAARTAPQRPCTRRRRHVGAVERRADRRDERASAARLAEPWRVETIRVSLRAALSGERPHGRRVKVRRGRAAVDHRADDVPAALAR